MFMKFHLFFSLYLGKFVGFYFFGESCNNRGVKKEVQDSRVLLKTFSCQLLIAAQVMSDLGEIFKNSVLYNREMVF